MAGYARPWTLGAVTAVAIGIAVASGVFAAPDAPGVLWDAPHFELVDQSGSTFSSAALEGTPYVASFVFTHCPDVCPRITARMADLRDELRQRDLLGDEVRLVSFSVDPERDSPSVLRAYAERFGGARPDGWAFLTGRPAEMRNVVTDGFKLGARRVPGGDTSPRDDDASAADAAGEDAASSQRAGHTGPHESFYTIAHSNRLVLVDGAGRIRGTYPASDPEALAQLRADLEAILN